MTKKSTSSSFSFVHPHDKHPNDVLMSILDLEELDVNLFRGYSPKLSQTPRVFGGQTVAQALVAAGRTVDTSKYSVHSLHSYFLRPGSLLIPILYHVERVRDGQSFSTRRVSAKQSGKDIFIMDASFMITEEGLSHQYSMPVSRDPLSVDDWEDNFRRFADERGLTVKRPRWSPALPFPLDVRKLVGPTSTCTTREPRQLLWMRSISPASSSKSSPLPLLYHHAALAYMSDFAFVETALIPHPNAHWSESLSSKPKMQIASIDHAMWFHKPFRSDEWLLYEIDSPVASNGRGLCFGRCYTSSGTLVVSTAQEGLIRVIDWTNLSKHTIINERPTGKEIYQPNTNKTTTNSTIETSKSTDSSKSSTETVSRSKL